MAVSESLEEARSSSRSSGTASGSLPEGGVSLTRKRRARSHEDHPFPKRKREPSVFNTTLRPFGRVAGILHVACFLKESDFLLLTLKKKKPFKKLTQHVCHSTDHKDGVSLPWATTVSIWTPGPDVPLDSAHHTRVSLLR